VGFVHAVLRRRYEYGIPRRAVMKISARNVLKGTILKVKKGTTTAHVELEIGDQIVTASITNEAVEELGLKKGMAASAVIKSSDVMIAVK
jgi:molybdopterin-binding protein